MSGEWQSVSDFETEIARAGRAVAAPHRRPPTPFDEVIADLRRQRSKEHRRPERRLLQRAVWATRTKQREWRADEELAALTHCGASSSKQKKALPEPRRTSGRTAALTETWSERWRAIVGHDRTLGDETAASRERLQKRTSAPAELELPDLYWEATWLMTNHARGKAGGEDGVVAEFVQALSPEQKCRLADMIHVVLCGSIPAPPGWRRARVTLIPKVAGALLATEFRPITVLPFTLKLSMRVCG